MRDSARSKTVDEILSLDPPIAPPLPDADPLDVEREEARDAAMVEVVEAETLEAELARPTLSARRTLKQTIDERAGDLADHAVTQALRTKGKDGVFAVTRLINVADAPEVRMPTTSEEVQAMTFIELTRAVAVLKPELLTEDSKRLLRAKG
jgi:hypothetical protein